MEEKVVVHQTIKRVAQELNIPITPQAILALTDITIEKSSLIAKDLEHFAKHGKRQTVNSDDIKLLCRHNPDLVNNINIVGTNFK